MKITQTQKSGKFSISNITFSEMVQMYSSINMPSLQRDLYDAMLDSLDDDAILEEYGYSAIQYLEYALATK